MNQVTWRKKNQVLLKVDSLKDRKYDQGIAYQGRTQPDEIHERILFY